MQVQIRSFQFYAQIFLLVGRPSLHPEQGCLGLFYAYFFGPNVVQAQGTKKRDQHKGQIEIEKVKS
jgi:hypothetical protein